MKLGGYDWLAMTMHRLSSTSPLSYQKKIYITLTLGLYEVVATEEFKVLWTKP